MKTWKKIRSIAFKEEGASAVVIALTLGFLAAMAAFAVDVGYVMATKNELQNSADAAALAATGQLGHLYEPMTPAQQAAYMCDDPAPIVGAAQSVSLQNTAAGMNITVLPTDVRIGQWDSSAHVLNETNSQPDAVRVTARRDGSANGPITTFFAKVFGKKSVPVSATATAALTGLSKIDEGGLPLPVGISKRWFSQPQFCNQPIVFYPTNNNCAGTDFTGLAGWNTQKDPHANASTLKKILQGSKEGTYTSPETTVGDSFYFTGGTVASAFDEMQALFDYMKTRDEDGNDSTWTTTVAVYDSDCGNPHGGIQITGFATVVIEQVLTVPEKTILGRVICENVEHGRGSGGNYGTKGSIPGLVQ